MTLIEAVSFDEEYRRRLAAGQFDAQRCASGHAVFPPRPVCPACGDRKLQWVTSVGRGVVYSATTLSPGDADPYQIVIVDIDDGFRMMSRVDGPEGSAVSIGDRVRVVIRPVRDGGEPLPCVEPVRDDEGEGRDG